MHFSPQPKRLIALSSGHSLWPLHFDDIFNTINPLLAFHQSYIFLSTGFFSHCHPTNSIIFYFGNNSSNILPTTLTVSLSFCGDSKCLFELFSLANTGDMKKDWVEAKHEVDTLWKTTMVRKSKFPSIGICITIR